MLKCILCLKKWWGVGGVEKRTQILQFYHLGQASIYQNEKQWPCCFILPVLNITLLMLVIDSIFQSYPTIIVQNNNNSVGFTVLQQ